MAQVQFTDHLKRFFPELREMSVEASTVAELVKQLDLRHKGLADYIVDERGSLRKHVNIFVGSEMVRDRATLSDPLVPDAKVFILQALSGG